METSEDYNRLRDWLISRRVPRGEIVVVDGETGSGKTNLVMRLTKDLNAIRVSLDCYVRPGCTRYYVDCLEHEYLKDDIGRFCSLFPLVFVEGICVREALERTGFTWHSGVYVKRIASNGLWHFPFHLDEFIAKTSQPEDHREPWRSDYDYHSRYRPHEDANFTYVRVSD